MDYINHLNKHNIYTDYINKQHPFGETISYDKFKAVNYPSKVIVNGVYKISAGKEPWFIDYQDNFKILCTKYLVLEHMDYKATVGFGHFISQYGTKTGGEVEFAISYLEYCFDNIDDYINDEKRKRMMPIIGFKIGGETCI